MTPVIPLEDAAPIELLSWREVTLRDGTSVLRFLMSNGIELEADALGVSLDDVQLPWGEFFRALSEDERGLEA